MIGTVIAIILVLIAIVVFIVFVLTWGGVKVAYASPSTPGVTGPPGFGYSCKDAICPAPYICDPGTVICKFGEGEVCTSANDCLTSFYCSGVCTSGPHGGLLENCPCDDGLICSPTNTSQTICKGGTGVQCNSNNQCVSGLCLNGSCSGGSPNGTPCTTPFTCASLYCDPIYHFCQPVGVISGGTGSSCIAGQGPPGTSGATGAGCNQGLVCTNFVCLPGVGLASGCSINQACSEPLICTDSTTGNACANNSAACSCLFAEDPNTCPDNACMSADYICNTSTKQCSALRDQPCITNTDCVSGTCLSTPAVFFLRTDLTANNIIGAETFTWVRMNSLPGDASRITGYSSGVDDFIYAVIPGLGLYSFSGSWNLRVPSTSSKVMIDAVVKSNGALIAFYETLPSMITGYTLYSWDGTNLTPYNVISQAGYIDGTQFDIGMNALTISSIDLSSAGDVVINQSNPGTPMVKSVSNNLYSTRGKTNNTSVGAPMSNVSLPQFYFDLPRQNAQGATLNWSSDYNFGYIGPQSTSNLLQFNGNISGALYPNDFGPAQVHQVSNYSIYSPSTGMNQSTLEFISQDTNLGAYFNYIISNGVQVKIPGFVDNTNRTLVTANRIYMYSSGICQ